MEPFSIECTTCQASLRVRDAAAIGQILTCPKCGSMVMVEAPTATALGTSSEERPQPEATPFQGPVTAIAAESGTEPSEARAPRSPAGPSSRTPVHHPRPMFLSDTVEDLSTYGTRDVDAGPQVGPGRLGPEAVLGGGAEDEGSLVESGRFRSWTLLTGAAITGVILAIVFVNSVTPEGQDSEELAPETVETPEIDTNAGSELGLGIELAPGATQPSRRVSPPMTGGPSGTSEPPSQPRATVPVGAEPVSSVDSQKSGLSDPAVAASSGEVVAMAEDARAGIADATTSSLRPGEKVLVQVESSATAAMSPAGVPPSAQSAAVGIPAAPATAGLPGDRSLAAVGATYGGLTPSEPRPAGSASGSDPAEASAFDTLVPPPVVNSPPAKTAKPSMDALRAAEEMPGPATVGIDPPVTTAASNVESPPGMTPAPVDETGEVTSALRMAREFARLLGDREPAEVEVESSEGTPTAEGAGSAGASTEAPEVAVERPDAVMEERSGAGREVDVAARLRDSFESIAFEGRLGAFVDFLSDFSTIPISLDADALFWSKLTPATTISIPEFQASVEETLAAGLRPLGLAYTRLDGQLWVSRTADPAALRTVSYRVDDLAPTPADLVQLADLLTKVVAPQSWSPAGGTAQLTVETGVLRVQQTDARHFQIMRLCELLRVARGLPLRSSLPAASFTLGSPADRAAEKLNSRVTLSFLQPTRFQEVVQHLNESSGSALLVDWHALELAGCKRDSDVTLSCVNQPLREVLVNFLQPLGLTFRVVSADLVQITSHQREREQVEVALFQLQEAFPAEADQAIFLRQLETALGTERFTSETGNCRLLLDAPSRCLITVLPQSMHSALVEQLAAWKR